MRVMPSIEHLNAVKSRLDGARVLALEPYESSNDEEEEPVAAAKPAAPAKKAKF
jgi:hypothetical protein